MTTGTQQQIYQDKKNGKRVCIVGGTSPKDECVLVQGNDKIPYYAYLSQLVECDVLGTPNFERTAADDRAALPDEDTMPQPIIDLVETRVNLNMASAEEIAKRVPGVGYRIAKAIVDSRLVLPNEKFTTMDQVTSVSNRVNWEEIEKANLIFLG